MNYSNTHVFVNINSAEVRGWCVRAFVVTITLAAGIFPVTRRKSLLYNYNYSYNTDLCLIIVSTIFGQIELSYQLS